MTESKITPSERLDYIVWRVPAVYISQHCFTAEELSFFPSDNCNPVAAKPFQWIYVAYLGYMLKIGNSTCSKIKALHFISQMKTSKL